MTTEEKELPKLTEEQIIAIDKRLEARIQELELIEGQVEEKLETLDARDVSIGELLREMDQSKEKIVHLTSVTTGKKTFVIETVDRFSRAPNLEVSLRNFNILVELNRYFLKLFPEKLVIIEEKIETYRKKYFKLYKDFIMNPRSSLQFLPCNFMPEVERSFFEIIDMLLNAGLVSATDIIDYRKHIMDEIGHVYRDPEFGKPWGDEIKSKKP